MPSDTVRVWSMFNANLVMISKQVNLEDGVEDVSTRSIEYSHS